MNPEAQRFLDGPRFHKMGGKVYYAEKDLDCYVEDSAVEKV